MKIIGLLTDEKFCGDLEREYCVNQLHNREYRNTKLILFFSLINVFLTPIYFYLFCPSIRPLFIEIFAGHILFGSGLIWAAAKYWQTSLHKRINLWINLICISAVYLTTSQIAPGSREFVYAFIFTMVITALFLMLLPFRNRVHWAVVVFLSVVLYGSIKINGGEISLFAIGILIICFSSSIGIILYRSLRSKSISEFRELSRYVPHQIIKHSVKSGTSLANVYKSTEKFCVCLSSDWRSFQNATKSLTPTQVGNVLAAYYSMINKILDKHFPEGNYFYDWIADELFAVFFNSGEFSDKQIVDSSIKFSQDVIQARIEFESKHGLPVGLDVGLAAGQAVIGIFGPEGQAKATAFGECPGVSRRVQTLGKPLRTDFGVKDRIIFGSDVEAFLDPGDFEICNFEVSSGAVKDVEETEFFYIDPGSGRFTEEKKAS